MKLNFIKKTLLLLTLSLAIISCDSEDHIGDSQLSPTTPSISIDLGFADPVMLIEDDSTYDFTVTMSETQIVDTRLYVTQVGGTADDHDYEVTGLIVIPAGYTSGAGTIKILADELIEDVETLTLQIGDQRTANSSMTPVTVSFTISNATSDDLVIGLSWAASELATDNSGEEISASAIADMRLLVTNSPYTGIFGGADGGSFETYEMVGFPDGEYLIVADFWDQFTAPVVRDLDLHVTFDQIGTINGLSYDFPAVINNGGTCAANYTVLAKVIKTGSNYDITPVGVTNAIDVEGDWSVEMTDAWGDGWNGGFLTATIDGVSTNYSVPNTGGGGVPGTVTEMFNVPAGSSLQLTYTPNGGAGAPGYEEENTYVITAPDGTIYADGPVPAAGTIVDSDNTCP